VLGFDVPFASLRHHVQNLLGQVHFAEPNQHALTFLHPKFVVQCTGGVALVSTFTTHKVLLHCSKKKCVISGSVQETQHMVDL
jgi:hypothetical protein